MQKNLSLKILSQTFISLFLIIIILFLAFWSYNEAKEELVSSYSSYTLAIAQNNANKIEERFHDLTLLFDYLAESIKKEGIKEDILVNPYFKKSYSSIADDFIVFDNQANVLCYHCIKAPFINLDQLADKFNQILEEEKGLPTPRLSEYKVLKIKNRGYGIFLYFDKLLYGPEKKEIYMTFIISGQHIYDTYIRPLRLSNEGYAYIIDDDEIVVSSGIKEHIGKNFNQIESEELTDLLLRYKHKSKAELEKIKKNFNQHKEEKGLVFSRMVEGDSGTARYLGHGGKGSYEILSFYPIDITGDSWSFAVKTPYSFITSTLKGNFKRTVILSVIFVIILFLDFVYIIYNYKKRLKAEFEVDHVSEMLDKEHMIRKTQYKFKQLYQGTKDIILICDENFLIEELNKAGIAAIGKNIKNISQKMKFQDRFINKDDFDDFTSILDKSGTIVDFETRVETNGNVRYFMISADKNFDEMEKKTFIYFVIRDITEHKKLQEEIINKEKLESTMALIVTANHEINNPLAGIVLNSELIKKIIDSEDEESQKKVKKLIDSINEEAYRISDVLKTLSDIEEIREKEYDNITKMLDIDVNKTKNR